MELLEDALEASAPTAQFWLVVGCAIAMAIGLSIAVELFFALLIVVAWILAMIFA